MYQTPKTVTLADRRDAMTDLARFTLDPVERLAALTASERMDAAAIENEYTQALADLEAAR